MATAAVITNVSDPALNSSRQDWSPFSDLVHYMFHSSSSLLEIINENHPLPWIANWEASSGERKQGPDQDSCGNQQLSSSTFTSMFEMDLFGEFNNNMSVVAPSKTKSSFEHDARDLVNSVLGYVAKELSLSLSSVPEEENTDTQELWCTTDAIYKWIYPYQLQQAPLSPDCNVDTRQQRDAEEDVVVDRLEQGKTIPQLVSLNWTLHGLIVTTHGTNKYVICWRSNHEPYGSTENIKIGLEPLVTVFRVDSFEVYPFVSLTPVSGNSNNNSSSTFVRKHTRRFARKLFESSNKSLYLFDLHGEIGEKILLSESIPVHGNFRRTLSTTKEISGWLNKIIKREEFRLLREWSNEIYEAQHHHRYHYHDNRPYVKGGTTFYPVQQQQKSMIKTDNKKRV